MSIIRILTLIFSAALISISSAKANEMDTTKIKKLLNLDSYGDGQIKNQVKRGVQLLVNDSIDMGIRLIGESIDQYMKTDDLFKNVDYMTLEVFSIVRDFGLSTLSYEEKQFRDLIVKAAVSNDLAEIDRKIEKSIKKSSDSKLLQRMHIFIKAIENDGHVPIKELGRLLDMIPEHDPTNLLMGLNLLDQERFKESLHYLNKSIEANPINAFTYRKRGDCYAGLNELKLAVKEYTTAVELDPQFDFAFNRRGDAYYRARKYKEALIDYTKAIELDPKYKYYWKDRGNAYIELGEYSNAIKDLEKSVNLDSEYDYAINRIGDCYYALGEYDTAMKLYARAIELDPDYKYYWKDLANSYIESGDYTTGIKLMEKTLSLDKKYDYAIKRIGDCHYHLKEYKTAITYYDRTLTLNPEFRNAHFTKGLCYGALNMPEEAIKTYESLIKVAPKHPTAFGNIGWEYYRLGDFEKCIEYSEIAIELDDRAAYAMFNISLATLRLGKVNEANKLYVKYRDYCNENGINIVEGVLQDLRDLRDQNIQVEEVNFILEEIFK